MKRSKSRTRLMETSFDSRTFSSSEDLDEVDRLANHPVLRSCTYLERNNRLRKSRSESGDFLCRGTGSLSVWAGDNFSVSNQCSPTGYALPRSKAMIFNPKLSRSNTVNVQLASDSNPNYQRTSSPTLSGTSEASSNWVFQKQSLPISSSSEIVERTPKSPSGSCRSNASSTHYVVRAVIENVKTPTSVAQVSLANSATTTTLTCSESNQRKCFSSAPPTVTKIENNLGNEDKKTPPNTAPLPNKFGRAQQHHDLLRFHKQAQQISPELLARNRNEKRHGSKMFSRPMNLKEDSSSSDSTPQKMYLKSVVRRGTEVKVPLTLAPKPILDLSRRYQTFGVSSGPGHCDSSNCSSAMSSLESIRSNNSDGVQSILSTESGAVSSMSSQSSDLSGIALKPTFDLRNGKTVQILSPISDKSQEQYSEHGDQGKTPKASPNENDNFRSELNSNNNNQNDNDNVVNLVNDNLDNVPWDMPKLRRRMNLNHDHLKMQGSDSGISTGSQQDILQQQHAEISELMNVPWDMPKLRKRTTELFRPQSMPVSSSNLEQQQKTEGVQQNQEEEEDHDLQMPPPPPGFEDSGDEFYLSQTNPETPVKKGIFLQLKFSKITL